MAAFPIALTMNSREASTYPAGTVRVIVPYAPGGATDVFSRIIAPQLSRRLDRQLFVENIGGAGGNIGMNRGARSAPDGRTLVVIAAPFVVNPALYHHILYDPVKDFDPVTLAVITPCVLAINASIPALNVRELVALVNANPGKFTYASPGTGTIPHLVGESFRLFFQLDIVHVPFNSGGLAISSALAGNTPISFGVPAPLVPFIAEGRLRALAVTGTQRSAALPDIPTMAEIGYPQIEGEQWYGIVVATGTPTDIITLLYQEVTSIIEQPDISQLLKTVGLEPIASSPGEFATRIRMEIPKWENIIRRVGISAD
jgi:tripartite-type tricarboxylate transporter receptor subunit TctC